MINLRVALTLVGFSLAISACTSTNTAFTTALVADRPSPTIRPDEDLYAPLIGAWDVRVVDRLEDGREAESRGEWIFSRVLEGRAIEDVFVTPRRPREPASSTERNRYGASLRMFDPTTRRWKVVWMNPVSGGFDILWARAENGSIVQEGVRPDGQPFRWTFEGITSEAFHWIGEAQLPNGSWTTEVEFFATRRR